MIAYTKQINHKLLTKQEKRLYNLWHSMRGRCITPTVTFYRHYGGRGISVCQRWIDAFENFVADVGFPPEPEGYDLDRIDNDGNYEPGNVRWVTHRENVKNTRSNRHVTIELDGVPVTKLASEWADQYGIGRPTFCVRMKLGWTGMKLLSKPQPSGYGDRLKIGDIEKPIPEWAASIGISEVGFRMRMARGWTGQQLLSRNEKWRTSVHHKATEDSLFAELNKSALDDGATRPKESQDASETGRDLHEEDKGERAG